MLSRDFKYVLLAGALCLSASVNAQELPELPPFPEIPAKKPLNSVKMQSSSTFQEVQLDLPITAGPYEASWVSIEKNYPGTPEWLREAKFGIWVHKDCTLIDADFDLYKTKIGRRLMPIFIYARQRLNAD